MGIKIGDTVRMKVVECDIDMEPMTVTAIKQLKTLTLALCESQTDGEIWLDIEAIVKF